MIDRSILDVRCIGCQSAFLLVISGWLVMMVSERSLGVSSLCTLITTFFWFYRGKICVYFWCIIFGGS
ncbi:Os02g0653000 [Oryza sativa Japonica Group]|uniref:Os02g0653000 protein n=1 Tax=Oryza sativa subsp. japonica TaxID=39947 RepID=Q6H8G8_ORYSJ|nr:unknown protein [Oryza sativa Japonica Group]BAF09516.1 Os02g0653000 [Oryza sativa Japonica Group]|eukprot:NP_001047602.1 Os02g0653000 [Oryza sativa Japonica Group]